MIDSPWPLVYSGKMKVNRHEDRPTAEIVPDMEGDTEPETWTEPSPEPSGALAPFDPLRRYLHEIGKYRLLTREQETDLATRYRETGDQEAAYQLVTANLRLVVKIAMEFQNYWLKNLLDLIQEGNVGLMQALRKFDPYRGVKFSYYASYWIKAYILKFIMDNWHLVRVGTTQTQRKLFYNLKKEKDRLLAEGLEPGPKLLAERLQVREKDILDMDIRLDGREVSLDAPLKDNSEDSHLNFLVAEVEPADDVLADNQIRNMLRHKLEELRGGLSSRELMILDKRIMADNPATLHEMGEAFGVSRERVRQLEERLKEKIRLYLMKEIPDLDQGTALDHLEV